MKIEKAIQIPVEPDFTVTLSAHELRVIARLCCNVEASDHNPKSLDFIEVNRKFAHAADAALRQHNLPQCGDGELRSLFVNVTAKVTSK